MTKLSQKYCSINNVLNLKTSFFAKVHFSSNIKSAEKLNSKIVLIYFGEVVGESDSRFDVIKTTTFTDTLKFENS